VYIEAFLKRFAPRLHTRSFFALRKTNIKGRMGTVYVLHLGPGIFLHGGVFLFLCPFRHNFAENDPQDLKIM
jgi:hypothetical protein